MDISVEDFNVDDITPRSISCIIGNVKSGKSTLIKDILSVVSKKYPNHVICTDREHKQNYYSKFIDGKKMYNRYSSIITNRCFFNNMVLVLDNCLPHKLYIEEIYDNYQGKDMVILLSCLKFYNDINYDFIFISQFNNVQEIYKIYTMYVAKFDVSAEQFVELIKFCTTDNEILVINCHSLFLEELFMTYKADLHEDLDLRDD